MILSRNKSSISFNMDVKFFMDIHTPINIDKTSNLANGSPKIRPMPTFFMQQATFSTKKEKDTPKIHEVVPPKPPIKSCPPISRLRPRRKTESGARVISFLNDKNNDSDIISKHYDVTKMDLFFEQCFIIEGNIGLGSFGKVYKVKNREDGKYYAVKKSREGFKGNADRIRKLEEVVKHESLPPHPNCVRFYRAWEEKQHLYIQIELCQMSLNEYAEMHHYIPEKIIWQFLVDLLQAIKHLHDHNLIHMDIKPENIFISHDYVCKLGDFGLVIDLTKNDLKEAQEGDPKYLAPEVLEGKFTKAADLFSLGMTIIELATDLDVPKSGEAWHELRTGQLPKDLKHNLSDNLVDIIVKMIDPNYLTRPTVDQLLQMPIIQNVVNKRKRKLVYLKYLSYLQNTYQYLLNMFLTIWYFIIYPIKKCLNINTNNMHTTSTPKRNSETDTAPIKLMQQIEYDDCEDHFQINDSFSTYNNSIGQPLFDSSSSSCENSDMSIPSHRLYSSRKLHTEPANKVKPSIVTLTPTKTPPWKTSSSTNSPVKLPGSFRQKLVFDDFNDNDTNEAKSPQKIPPQSTAHTKSYKKNIQTVLIKNSLKRSASPKLELKVRPTIS